FLHHHDLHSFPTRRSSDLNVSEATLDFPVSLVLSALLFFFIASDFAFLSSSDHDEVSSNVLLSSMIYFASSSFFGAGKLRYSLRSEEHTSELQSRFDLVCR